jgi:hypothetical protein
MLRQETLVSHSALNQLSYIIGQAKKEVKVHLYYNSNEAIEKISQLSWVRKTVIEGLFQNEQIINRIQRYMYS